MTHKPMLSVERDLIERAVQAIINTSQMQPALNELRALLDKPAPAPCQTLGCFDNAAEGWRNCEAHKFYMLREPAAQHQGEPVAYMVQTGTHVEVLFEGNDWLYKYRKAGMRVTPLYAEQPAPVGVVMPDNLLSHRESWLQAMERLVALEAEATPPTHDSDEPGYWERELKSMRDMYADFDRLNGVKP